MRPPVMWCREAELVLVGMAYAQSTEAILLAECWWDGLSQEAKYQMLHLTDRDLR